MFDTKQTEIIKRALAEYDDRESAMLVGDEQVKYEFTNHFEEQAEALKKRVLMGVKVSVKKVLLLAAAVVLVLSVTVAMVAGNDMHVIRFGNNINYDEYADAEDPEERNDLFLTYATPGIFGDGELDIPAMIIEADLPIPEGYKCSMFDPLRKSSYNIYFSKDSEKVAYRDASLTIHIYEIYENTGVRLDHDGDMLVLEMGDLKVYHYSKFYLLKASNYACHISCNDPDVTDDQILAIFESINNMMTAPMRTEEEIKAEYAKEPSIAVRTGWSELYDWEGYNLDFSAIEYRLLELPEGYMLTQNAMNIISKYSKSLEPFGAARFEIEMIDLTVDPYIASLYENPGMAHEFEDITIYSRGVGYMEDYLDEAMEYVFVDEHYAAIFRCEAYSSTGDATVITPEEASDIARQIREYMKGQ